MNSTENNPAENNNRRRRGKNKKQLRKIVRIEAAFLAVLVIALGIFLYKDYHERPGFLERESITAVERTTDTIVLEWDKVRNTDTYNLYYKPKDDKNADWTKVSEESDEIETLTVPAPNEEEEQEGQTEAVEMQPAEEGEKPALTEPAEAEEPEPAEAAEEPAEAAEDSEETVERVRMEVSGLDEGTTYGFVIRADSEERDGFSTKVKYFNTKASQEVKSPDKIIKLRGSKDFDLGAEASTPITYKSSNKEVLTVDKETGTITIKGSGKATITAIAEETESYVGAKKKTEITVLNSTPVDAGGASAYVIMDLDAENCTVVKAVTGSGSIHVPQGIGYSGDNYYIAYGDSSRQRIITFAAEGDDKYISTPGINLGHPNGFCYSDETGLCYSVRGWSGRCVTYSPESGVYSSFMLSHGCSGIGYDREEKVFYTSSRTAMRMLSGDGNFATLHSCGTVSHSGKVYTQDCGGGSGIMFHCISGSNKHGTNYIDIYNMYEGTYLGSLRCDLSEVESCFVDDEGFLEILANNSSREDYIWKTPIKPADLP